MDVNDYNNAEDDAASQGLFDSQYTSRELAYVLADEISIMAGNGERVAFLDQYQGPGLGGWVRGNIVRALSAKGVTVQTINRRMA